MKYVTHFCNASNDVLTSARKSIYGVPSFASAVVTPLSVAANAGLELACYLARTCTFLKSSTSLVTVQPNYCQDPLSKFTPNIDY